MTTAIAIGWPLAAIAVATAHHLVRTHTARTRVGGEPGRNTTTK